MIQHIALTFVLGLLCVIWLMLLYDKMNRIESKLNKFVDANTTEDKDESPKNRIRQ